MTKRTEAIPMTLSHLQGHSHCKACSENDLHLMNCSATLSNVIFHTYVQQLQDFS